MSIDKEWAKMNAPLESAIQKEVKEYLESRGFLVVKFNNSGIWKGDKYIPTHQAGVSDLLCFGENGRFIAVEVKRPNGKLTALQKQFQADMRNRGHEAITVFGLDDIVNYLNKPAKK